MEEEIIQPIDRELLKSELTPDKQLRMTNKSHNEIYIVTANDSPNVLKEIGRLREIAFREAGGGTGKSMDLDEFDFGDNCYKQLIVWNPEADEIIGGYRYLLGRDWQLDEKGQPKLASHLPAQALSPSLLCGPFLHTGGHRPAGYDGGVASFSVSTQAPCRR